MEKPRSEKKSKFNWLKIIIGLAITGLALWLSFRKLDWAAVKEAFLQVNFFWVILALINTMIVVYALGWRWQVLLKPKAKISLNALFRLNIISQYINIIIPGRFGEISKIYLASRRYPVSGAYATGTIVIEKILDFTVFVFLWVLVPALFALEKEVRGYKIALGVCALTVILFIIFIWRPKTILNGTKWLARLLPLRLRSGFQDFIEKGIESFALLRNTKTLLFVFALTFGFVGGQVVTNFLLFKAFHLHLSFWIGLFLLLAVQVGNIPPSVPGKIGIFEYAVILALSLFDVSKSQALSYAILLHVVAFVPKILLGVIFIASMDLSLKKVRQERPK